MNTETSWGPGATSPAECGTNWDTMRRWNKHRLAGGSRASGTHRESCGCHFSPHFLCSQKTTQRPFNSVSVMVSVMVSWGFDREARGPGCQLSVKVCLSSSAKWVPWMRCSLRFLVEPSFSESLFCTVLPASSLISCLGSSTTRPLSTFCSLSSEKIANPQDSKASLCKIHH